MNECSDKAVGPITRFLEKKELEKAREEANNSLLYATKNELTLELGTLQTKLDKELSLNESKRNQNYIRKLTAQIAIIQEKLKEYVAKSSPEIDFFNSSNWR